MQTRQTNVKDTIILLDLILQLWDTLCSLEPMAVSYSSTGGLTHLLWKTKKC